MREKRSAYIHILSLSHSKRRTHTAKILTHEWQTIEPSGLERWATNADPRHITLESIVSHGPR